MVKKYVRLLEENIINANTNETWKLSDVPATWRKKAETQVLADGYTFDEDGVAHKAA